MANLTSPVLITPGTYGSPAGNGNIIRVQGTFPTGAATATAPVGMLREEDSVFILPLEGKTDHKGFAYDKAGSTFNTSGTALVSVKTIDGVVTPSTMLIEVLVIRN